MLYLESSWGKTKISTISKKIGRSETAIKVKAYKLGLSSMLDNKDFLISRELEDLLGTDRKTIKKHINERGLKAKNKKLCSKAYVVVEYEDLVDWLYSNPSYWNAAKSDTDALLAIGLNEDFLLSKKEEDSKNMKLRLFTNKETVLLKKLYREGYTYEKMASILNKNVSSIHYKLSYLSQTEDFVLDRNNRGILKRTTGSSYGWTKEQDEKLISMFLKGVTLKEIAKAVGKSYSATKTRNQVLTKLIREGKLYEKL